MVSRGEMRRFVREEENSKYQLPVDTMIATADSNRDGKLSLSEVMAHSKQMGHSTTDFFEDPDLLTQRLNKAQAQAVGGIKTRDEGEHANEDADKDEDEDKDEVEGKAQDDDGNEGGGGGP